MPPDTHLYYRLPVLEPGVQPPSLDVGSTLLRPSRMPVYHAHLRNIRELLAKERLGAADAFSLVQSATVLMKTLLYDHQTPVPKETHRALWCLGLRYLLVEALYCTAQVIGASMNASQWWLDVVGVVPTIYDAPWQKNFTKRSNILWSYCNRLSAALNSLQKGVRPNQEETVSLKRALFGPHTVREFRDHRWSLWKEDDENSGGAASC